MMKARSRKDVFAKPAWLWLLGCGLLGFGGCSGAPSLDIQLVGLPVDAVRVEVTTALDSVSALEGPQSLTPPRDRIHLQIAGRASGSLKLHVGALDRGNCEIAAGDGIVQLHGAATEAGTLQLSPKEGCRIDVAFIGGAKGVVQVGMNGPICSDDCRIPARRDDLVPLSFTPMTGYILGGWFAPDLQQSCSGRGSCTIQTASGVTTVQVASLHDTSCASSGWCLEEDTPALASALYGLWGESRVSIWAVGDSGAMLHSDGFRWSSVSRVTSRALRSIWGSGSSDIWIVGEFGTILHYDGQAFSVQPRVTTSWLLSVWGSAPDDVWAVGDGGTILHWDGALWKQVGAGVQVSLRSVWGSSASSVWAVGDAGTILYYGGTSWSLVPSNTSVNLYGVAGSGPQSVWAVGDLGAALHLDARGTPPTSVSTGTGTSLRSVFVPAPDVSSPACAAAAGCPGWAAGLGGVLVPLRETASSTAPLPSSFDPTGAINKIWGPDGRNVWAVGQGTTIVRYRP